MPDGQTGGTALTATQQFNLQLDEQVRNFQIMLPQHVPLDKFKRVVVTAVIQDPKLFNADRKSLFLAAQKCASDGLLPDGREAVLLPFNSKVKRRLDDGTTQEAWVDLVQYIPMIQGIRQRMRNTGLVASAEAYVVHRNDKFFQKFGSDPQIVHEPPALGTPRGDPVGAYAIIRLISGEVIQEVMDRDEIERIRSFSKAKDGPAWKNHWGEMARKTVLRRAAKSAPTSAEMLQLLDRDDEPAADPGMVDVTGAHYEPEPPRQAISAGQQQESGASFVVIDADGEEHEYATADAVAAALRIIFADAQRRGAASLDAAAENNATALRLLTETGHERHAEELTEHWRELRAGIDPFGLPPLDQPHPAHPAPERHGAGDANGPHPDVPHRGAAHTPAGAEQPQDRKEVTTTDGPERASDPERLPAASPAGGADLFPGDAERQEENLFVPLPRDPKPADWEFWTRQLLALIDEGPRTPQRLARIRLKNEYTLKRLKAADYERYREAMSALNEKAPAP